MEYWTEISVGLLSLGSAFLALAWREQSDPFGRGAVMYGVGLMLLLPGITGLLVRWLA